jgi:branched-chain amino acid transport system ATP-binding protein
MDEPSAGLSSLFVGQVISVLSRFREQGLAMPIAEQTIAFVDLVDRVSRWKGAAFALRGRSRNWSRRSFASDVFGLA